MKKTNVDVVILGAGLTGLAIADLIEECLLNVRETMKVLTSKREEEERERK